MQIQMNNIKTRSPINPFHSSRINLTPVPGSALTSTPAVTSTLKMYEAEKFVDTDISELSSVKLLSILRLHSLEGCQLEAGFIAEVKAELQHRGDRQEWTTPH